MDERRRPAHRLRPGLTGGAAESVAGVAQHAGGGGGGGAAVANPVASPEPADQAVAEGSVHAMAASPGVRPLEQQSLASGRRRCA